MEISGGKLRSGELNAEVFERENPQIVAWSVEELHTKSLDI